MSNVEFYRTGQEGWTERYDPRFSLAWVDTRDVTEARPSFVDRCAFHDGFSTAIGIFGAGGIRVTNNVVHRTINDGELLCLNRWSLFFTKNCYLINSKRIVKEFESCID